MQYIDGRYIYYKNHLESHLQEELDNIAYNMLGRWDGADRIHNTLSDELFNEMLRLSAEEPYKKINFPNRLYFEEVVIPRAVAYTERRLMMEKIADLSPRWYGADADEDKQIPGVEYRPRLTYEDKLPKAYYLSKINLSSTLHSIMTGLPLRIFDIMGAGGFIMTNYQKEMEDLFDIGKEIVVYHNFDEMRELTQYFLKHEDIRMQILVEGYNRICNDYTYPIAVKKIMRKVFD